MQTRIIAGIADASIPAWRYIDRVMFNQLLWPKVKNKIITDNKLVSETWIDSGGFQYMMHDFKPRIRDILKRYHEIEKIIGPDNLLFIMVDEPPRSLMDKGSWKRNIRLYEELVTRYRGSARIIPVIHFYYPSSRMLEALDYYMQYDPPIIAYGGIIPPLLKKTRFRVHSLLGLLLLRRSYNGWIHTLGAGSPIMLYLISILGSNSADTSTWRVKAAYGNILIPGKGERNVGRAKTWRAPRATKEDLEYLFSFLRKTGFPLLNKFYQLITSFKGRALINLWVITRMDPIEWGPGGFKWIEGRLKKFMEYSTGEVIDYLDKDIPRQLSAK